MIGALDPYTIIAIEGLQRMLKNASFFIAKIAKCSRLRLQFHAFLF